MLRFTIDPGCMVKERIEELVDFCKSAKVSDVMLITCAEELNTGHVTKEEFVSTWAKVFENAKEALEAVGVTASLNPWATTLHCDRGRTLAKSQNFRTMCDRYGKSASAVACPSDENYLDYIAEMYAEYARLSPDTLWIEDDMRLHNHSPLDWGGCFCEHHMKVFSEKIGHTVTREEFASAVCAEGEVHPWRKIWLDVARETICNLIERISDAVFKVNPNVRLGLMTSMPYVHCAEGRDWDRIIGALTGNRRPLVRVHLPAYKEPTSQDYGMNYTANSRLTAAYVNGADFAPELENYPYSFFTKSASFTDFQVKTAALLPSSAITLNIFDMMGSGVDQTEGYDEILRQAKPFLDSVSRLGLAVDTTRGVAVPTSPTASYRLHSTDGSSFTGLYPREYIAASLLSAFAISNHYSVDKVPSVDTVMCTGQALRNFDDSQLEEIFAKKRLILDGESLLVLADRQKLHLAGIKDVKVADIPVGNCAYEEFDVKIGGRDRVRMSAQDSSVDSLSSTGYSDSAGGILAVEYNESSSRRVICHLCSPRGEKMLDTVSTVDGRILILPYVNYPVDFGRRRCRPLMEVLTGFVGTGATSAMTPYLNVFEYTSAGRRVIALVNTSGDPIRGVKLTTEHAEDFREAEVISDHAPEKEAGKVTVAGENLLNLDLTLDRLDVVLIKS